MSSSEHSLLPQRALVPAAGLVVVAGADAVVGAQPVAELLQHRQLVQLHRLARRQQMPVVAVVEAADAAGVAALTPFPRFEDRQLSRGFHFSRGQQPSTTTIRRMP